MNPTAADRRGAVGRMPTDLLPAIDLRQGKVVRLRQGDDARRTVFGEDPVGVLADFSRAGARWVHVVDLDAAFGEAPQRELIERLARTATDQGLSLELGGGLRDRDAVAWAIEAGCSRVVVSSMIAKDFPLFASLVERYPGRMVPGLDFRAGRLSISGWTESSDLDLGRLASMLQGLDCPAALVTDISRDGEMGGANLELAREVGRATGIPSLLSGGVCSLEDLRQAAASPEIGGAIVGRALYDGTLSLREALGVLREEAIDPKKGLS